MKRIIDSIELRNCYHYPQLVAPLMKILTDGIIHWKTKIKDSKALLSNLMYIYFHYNTNNEYLELLKDLPTLQNKKLTSIDEF